MWDSHIARAVQVFPCKDTFCQQGLRVTCVTHGSSALHLSCDKLTGTRGFCTWPGCSLGCECVCVGKHRLTLLQSPGAAVLDWLMGYEGRQAVTAWPSGMVDTGCRVEMALLQPAGSRISQEDPHFYSLLQRWSLYSLVLLSDSMGYGLPHVIAEEIIISNKIQYLLL